MSLLSVLAGAQSSLAAQQGLTATASHNIDNANNPDYARQRATLEAVAPADQVSGQYLGQGAVLGSVTQARDRFLEAQLPRALGDAAQSSAESGALQAVTALDPQAAGGLGASLAAFYSSLRALAQDPGDGGLRAAALGASGGLARSFQQTSQGIAQAQAGLDAGLASLATSVASEAGAVADLNARIRQAAAAGGAPNDLLDLRQKHLDQLATLAGATTVTTSSGDVDVVLPGGAALVTGAQATTVSTRLDPAGGGRLQLVLGNGASPLAPPGAAWGGTIGGTLAARDGALATAAASIDRIAYGLATAANAVHAAGHGTDGSTGRALFDVGSTPTGAAARMTVTLTDASQLATAASAGAPGDATQLQALIATEQASIGGASGVDAALGGVVATFGAAASRAQAFAAQDGAVRDHLTSLRQSASGVSIDDEMIALQQAQRGYEAISRVIQTADQMMQTLLAIR